MFETAIFDWDGTLADTKRAIVASFQKALKQIHCEVNDDFILRLIGTGAKNTFKEALKAAKIQFDDEMLEELVKKKVQTGIELTGTVELFEGAVDILNSLREKVRVALASMSSREIIDKILEEKKIREYFDVIITVDEVRRPKPDPEIFLKCAAALKCPPERCVVLEDSIFGVEAAKKAKMKCIAVLTGAYSRDELERMNPDVIVNSLKERAKILNFILDQQSR